MKRSRRKGKKYNVIAIMIFMLSILGAVIAKKIPNNQSEFEKVQLVRVVDGDTIVVKKDETSEKIRLLGINTPESVHSDENKNNEYGVMASNYTKGLLKEGQALYLTYDVEKKDQYGRTLAYVWLKNDIDPNNSSDIKTYMLNAILIKDGMAAVTIYEPNDSYKDLFFLLESVSKINKTGLWQYKEYHEIVNKLS